MVNVYGLTIHILMVSCEDSFVIEVLYMLYDNVGFVVII